MKCFKKTLNILAILSLFFISNAYAGPIFEAAKASCLASGGADRFVIYSAGTSQNCSQACATVSCGTPATCVKGLTVWSSLTYQYSNECTANDPQGIGNITGKICCCTGTGCARGLSYGTDYQY